MRPLFVIGTRPEAIKLAPVIREFEKRNLDWWAYYTGQHAEETQWLAFYFEIAKGTVEKQFHGTPVQQLAHYSRGIESELNRSGCDVIVGQGDTFSALAASQVAFYARKKFVHVEAGLRTWNLNAPWPEEYNRTLISLPTGLHCCPTPRALENAAQCLTEDSTAVVTGNTVVDALLWTVAHEEEEGDNIRQLRDGMQDEGLVIITAHRRENQGAGIARICQAVSILAEKFPKVGFFWSAHPNPEVRREMQAHPSWPRNVIIQEPFTYPKMAMLLKSCTLVMTDSGGLQEESPTFRKPVVVLRNETERPELIEAGGGVLVGTDIDKIVSETSRLLSDGFAYAQMQVEKNPFGDGKAADKIVTAMQERFT